MANLREYVDGPGSYQINNHVVLPKTEYKPQDEVIFRRQTTRSGPRTNEVIVGRILAMNDNGTVDISIQKNGLTSHATVSLRDLSPVTESFKRSSAYYRTGRL